MTNGNPDNVDDCFCNSSPYIFVNGCKATLSDCRQARHVRKFTRFLTDLPQKANSHPSKAAGSSLSAIEVVRPKVKGGKMRRGKVRRRGGEVM